MALGTAAVLLLFETTQFLPAVRWPPYESAYNRTVKVTVKRPPRKSHVHSRPFRFVLFTTYVLDVGCRYFVDGRLELVEGPHGAAHRRRRAQLLQEVARVLRVHRGRRQKLRPGDTNTAPRLTESARHTRRRRRRYIHDSPRFATIPILVSVSATPESVCRHRYRSAVSPI